MQPPREPSTDARDPTGNTRVMGLAEGRRVWSTVFVNDTVLAMYEGPPEFQIYVEQGAVS
jgi:hypothetical protein